MSQEEALVALRARDFYKAAALLGTLVRENHFSSDVLNHAYTIALHRAGKGPELAAAAFEIGTRLKASSPAQAADYFQRAILMGLDEPRVQQICEWQGAIAEDGVRKKPNDIRTDRVAHVIGCFLSGHAPSLYVQLTSQALHKLGVESHVFTTEWTSSWFFNPPGVQQSDPPHVDADVSVARLDGDFFERAPAIAGAIRSSDIDIVLYHCGPSEQITVRVAALHPAAVQINVNHAEEVGADLFEGFAHLFRNGLERTRFAHRPKRWIPLISDIDDRLRGVEPMSRSELQLDSAQTVSATFGNLFKISERAYLDALARILRQHPGLYHVIAGAGDQTPIRKFLESENLIDRVRFVEHVPDVASMLPMIDVYLNSFPVSGGQSILEPMAAAKPTVIRQYPELSHHLNVGAELADIPELIAGNDDEYVDIANRLIESPDLGKRLGQQLQERFRAQFRPEGVGAKYLDFFQEVIGTLEE
jgi:hypothetical protein